MNKKNKLKKVPVVIINGFLGAGKTTLFRNLLNQSREKNISICAIVNDMSELDVDGQLIGNTAVVDDDSSIMKSIYSCVLSSELGIKKLDQAIQNLLDTKNPDCIIIETSGSCHPMPLVKYFKVANNVKLTGLFVLVDSLMMAHDFQYGQNLIPKLKENLAHGRRDTVNLLVEQILFCSHLIITKSDRIKKEKLQDITTFIKKVNPLASTHSVVYGRVTLESLLEIEEYNYFSIAKLIEELNPILEFEEDSNKPYGLHTTVIKDKRPFHPKRLWDVCHQYLDQTIYRSKGFFWLASRDKHSLLWSQAGGDINLEIIGTWRTAIVEDEKHGLLDDEIEFLKKKLSNETSRFGDRHCNLTVIGAKEQLGQFTERLKSCFLTEEEIKMWEKGFDFTDPWPKSILKIK